MAVSIPRHVICVLGNWRDFIAVDAVVRQMHGFTLDREFSQLTPDSRMPRSFEMSYERVVNSMKDADWDAIRKHTAVAYVLSPPADKARATQISGMSLVLTAALLRAGGVAAKGEAAGIAHGREQWLEFAADYAQARKDNNTHAEGATLYWTWVRRPLLDSTESICYSCGMHLLGMPDIEIEATIGLEAALQWIDLFGLYLVSDRPSRPIKEGEGFRLKTDGPRRIFRFGACKRYEEDSFMFNPYGYIRLERDE